MRCLILGFAAGVLLLQNAATLPGLAPLACCVSAALALLVLARYALRHVASATAGILLGYAWAAFVAQLALAPSLAPAEEGRDLQLIGVVDSLPARFEQGIRFNLKVEHTLTPGAATVPPRVALSWYTANGGGASPVAAVQPGQRWQLTVRLQRPHGNANPGGFDYEAWLLEQGVRATGYVRTTGEMRGSANRRLDDFVPGVGSAVERSRAFLRERILRALDGKPYAGVIVALVIGDQRGIDLGGVHQSSALEKSM